jgi:hypothetical protein
MSARILAAEWLLLPLVLSSGCVAATTYGLKTDGRTPEAGEVEFTAGGGAAASKLASLETGRRYWGAGGGVTYGLTDTLALNGTAGLGTEGWEDEEGNLNYDDFRLVEGELRWRMLAEDPGNFNLTSLFGVGSVVDESRDYNRVWGLHTGLVASHRIGGTARLYYGGKFNAASDDMHLVGAAGMTADAVTEGPVAVTFGFETFMGHAFLYETDPAFGAGLYLNFGPR